jgi:hypothetical protein
VNLKRYRARFVVLVDREFLAYEISGARQQAEFAARSIQVTDHAGESKPAMIYTIEEVKDVPTDTEPLLPDGRHGSRAA